MSRKNKLWIYLSALTVVLVALVLFKLQYYVDNKYEQQIQDLKVQEVDLVLTIVDEIYAEADTQVGKIAHNIKVDLIDSYTSRESGTLDTETLKLDLTLTEEGSSEVLKPSLVFEKNIVDITMNNTLSTPERNDPIVWINGKIVGSPSMDCAKHDVPSVGIEEEIPLHFAQKLARQTYIDITEGSVNRTFWHFKPLNPSVPWYEEVKIMNRASIEDLRALMIQYGIDVINEFEFLSLSRIDKYEDLLGNDVVSPSGIKNPESLQITVGLGFGYMDQLKSRPRDQLRLYQKHNEIIRKQDQRGLINSAFTVSLLCILCIVIFSLARLNLHLHDISNELDELKEQNDQRR